MHTDAGSQFASIGPVRDRFDNTMAESVTACTKTQQPAPRTLLMGAPLILAVNPGFAETEVFVVSDLEKWNHHRAKCTNASGPGVAVGRRPLGSRSMQSLLVVTTRVN